MSLNQSFKFPTPLQSYQLDGLAAEGFSSLSAGHDGGISKLMQTTGLEVSAEFAPERHI